MASGRPDVLVVDNYDSFTFTLVDYLRTLGSDVQVVRNREIGVGEAIAAKRAILISPGPGTPEDSGICVELAAACVKKRHPLLGVCLGHQAIAHACGASVFRTSPVHGMVGTIDHDGSGVFRGLPSQFDVTRYHSLAVTGLAEPLLPNAWASDGTVMGFRHHSAPIHGVQFHPESVATEHGHALLGTFLEIASASLIDA